MPDEAPPQITPRRLGDYLEVMSKAVFQTGISWRIVDAKWPGIRAAFRDFDARAVAALGPDEVDVLVADPRVIRNRRKIEAIAGNAARMLELEAEHGSFRAYLRSQPDFDALVRDLRRQFKFLGEMGCYYFLYVVREPVPAYEEWHAARTGAPRPRGAARQGGAGPRTRRPR
jgi:3-methyladenine DNA glycosylase Tag